MNRNLALTTLSVVVICSIGISTLPTFSRQAILRILHKTRPNTSKQPPIQAGPTTQTPGQAVPVDDGAQAIVHVTSNSQVASNSNAVGFQLLNPLPGLPLHTHMTIDTVDEVPGRLVCSYFDYKSPYTSSLVSCSIGEKLDRGNSSSQQLSCVTYPVQKSQRYSHYVVQGARISPNGHYVLFKFGEVGAAIGGAQLYVLDIQTNKVKSLPVTIGYRAVSWSPDSQYIACVEGGDANGNAYFQAGPEEIYLPMRLCMYNWQTGKRYLVAENDTIQAPFSWATPHTLLYGALSPKGQAALAKEPESQASTGVREGSKTSTSPHKKTAGSAQNTTKPHDTEVRPQPDVYEYNPDIGKSKLTIHDGYLPVPSCDGKVVAFFGSEHPERPYPLRPGWQVGTPGASLCVARRDGKDRKALNREGAGLYPMLKWLPDNRHLLAIKEVQSIPTEKIQIKEWEIETGHWRQVALIQNQDREPSQVTGLEAHFKPMNVSADGTHLYYSLLEFTGVEPGDTLIGGIAHLQTIDLRTGIVKPIADVKDAGVDFCEAPATGPPTASPNATAP